jgi:tetratricopeptide (TPR) repeat protein
MNFYNREFRQKWLGDMDNDLLRFQYSSVLAHSGETNDLREALLHLEHLVNNSRTYYRDALYLLAVVRYLLEDYDAARSCAEELLCMDPENAQVYKF